MSRIVIMAAAIAVLALIAAALVPALYAQDSTPDYEAIIDADGAAQLEDMVSKVLDEYKSAAEANDAQLKAEGDVLVEQADNFYAVTLPVLTYIKKNGARSEIGMIAINIRPGDTPEEWHVTLALPSPITLHDPAGNEIISVNLGSQNFAGIWHKDFKGFTKLNARYRDIAIFNKADNAKMHIPELSLTNDLKQSPDGLWSGPARLDIRGALINAQESGTALTSDRISLVSTIDSFSPQAAQAYQQERADKGTDGPAIIGHISGLPPALWNGFSFALEMENIAASWPSDTADDEDNSAAPDLTHMSFARGVIGIDMTGFGESRNGNESNASNAVNLGLHADYKDLEITPPPAGTDGLLPDKLALRVRIEQLPYSNIATPEGGPQQKLVAAGTALKVTKNIGNNHYNIATNIDAVADAEAAHSVTGTGRLDVAGFDYLLDAAKAAQASPGSHEQVKNHLQNVMAFLTIMQMMGQQSQDDQGRTVRSYQFELSRDGKVLLNGSDLSALIPAGIGRAE